MARAHSVGPGAALPPDRREGHDAGVSESTPGPEPTSARQAETLPARIVAWTPCSGLLVGALVLAELLALTGVAPGPLRLFLDRLIAVDPRLLLALLVTLGLAWAGRRRLELLLAPVALVLLASWAGHLTAALRPVTLDPMVAALESAVGSPSQRLAQQGHGSLAASGLELLGWVLLLGLLVLRERRRDEPAPGFALLPAALWVGGAGLLLLLVTPAVGPLGVIGQAGGWPDRLPPLLSRCALLSVPFAWALLVSFTVPRTSLLQRYLAWSGVALVALGSLLAGATWATGLLGALPLAWLGCSFATGPLAAPWPTWRSRLLAVGLLLGWRLTLASGVLVPASWTQWRWLIALALAAVVVVLLQRGDWKGDEDEADSSTDPTEPSRWHRALVPALLFFLSGFAALVYEVVFGKSLATLFGSSATASTTVLATYMGGIALGSWLGGRLAARRPLSGLLAYAGCEGLIAAWCLLSPLVMGLVRLLYVQLASGAEPGSGWTVALQVLLGCLVLLPPTVLMGMTLPLMSAELLSRDTASGGLGPVVGLLYAANTLGAATGAFATGYFLLPALGVRDATWLAVVLNLLAAILAYRLAQGTSVESAESDASDEPETADDVETADPALGRLGLLILGLGGVVSLALEVVAIHLLAVVVGTSVHAFGLMLSCFMVGLGLGASGGRRLLAAVGPLRGLLLAELGLALTVLLGVHLWDGIPDYFGSFAGHPLMTGFGERELVRFLACCAALLPPAACIGAAYPMAMACVGRGWPGSKLRALGLAAGLNTVGNILGAFLGGFVLLNTLGSLPSLLLLAGVALVVALVVLARLDDVPRLPIGVTVVVLALLLAPAQWRTFDLSGLASGTNVYFNAPRRLPVIDHAESLDGGLTTVTRTTTADGTPRHTLWTNGKFQGDDSNEMAAQVGFAVLPLVHAEGRERALVIGFGTGVTARIVQTAGFQTTEIAELSRDILDLAHEHFGHVNGEVLDRPGVIARVADGRNLLLVSEHQYDLVTIELTSIWFAGAGSLYNREFYELVDSKLTEKGVLQQWLQLHHLTQQDVVTALASVRAVFPKVWLYGFGGQGMIVACRDCSEPDPRRLATGGDELLELLERLHGKPDELLEARLLSPTGVDTFLQVAEDAAPLGALVSTDDNLFLEYSTPKGNVLGYGESVRANLHVLQAFKGL
ncbi:MAG: fused MFS/spermidine synthase [Acidobacteriota bacterium]